MRKIWLLNISVIMAVILVFGGLIGPATRISALSTSDNVNEMEAAQAALDCIERNSKDIMEWANAEVSAPIIYYAPDMTKAAYEFTVLNGGKDVGYIIVSARKDWMPILERSNGKAPSSYLSKAKQTAVEQGYITDSDKSEPIIIYLGACSYYAQFGERMKSEGTAVHLTYGITRSITKEIGDIQMDVGQSRQEWSRIAAKSNNILSRIFKPKSNSSIILTAISVPFIKDVLKPDSTSDFITQVTPFYQEDGFFGYGDNHTIWAPSYPDCAGTNDDPWDDWDGCAPIAGAMVVGYWSNMGYTGIPDPDTSGTGEVLIDHCHANMYTDFYGGTNWAYVDYGMEYVTDIIYDYDFEDLYTSASWEWVLYEIENNLPFVLSMDNWYYNGNYLDHAVCAYGYTDDGINHEIRVFSTWDTSTSFYIAYGAWSSAVISDVHP